MLLHVDALKECPTPKLTFLTNFEWTFQTFGIPKMSRWIISCGPQIWANQLMCETKLSITGKI